MERKEGRDGKVILIVGARMCSSENSMSKFDRFIGNWKLIYHIPKSSMSNSDTGMGSGTFKRILGDKFVSFDYAAKLGQGDTSAHGIFGFDEGKGVIRYWWFEDSGATMDATCDFVSDDVLAMNWHNSLLSQEFRVVSENKIILEMTLRKEKGEEVVLVVDLIKKSLP